MSSREHGEGLDRIARLERTVRRMQAALAVVVGAGAACVLAGFAAARGPEEEIRTKRVVVVDDAGVQRILIGQDAKDTRRRSRSAGLWIFDSTGAERAGMGTMDDGSVGFGMDAPTGVGAAMRDRLGMTVGADGSAELILIDNRTGGVVKLESAGDGRGGLRLLKSEPEAKRIRSKLLSYDGEVSEDFPIK